MTARPKLAISALLAVAGMLGPITQTADASPFVGEYDYLDSGTVAVMAADHTPWRISITATSQGQLQSRTEQRAYILIERCPSSCTVVAKWSQPLTDRQVTIAGDLTSGRLRLPLAGTQLHLDLVGRDTHTPVDGVAFTGLGVSTAPPGVDPGIVQERGASGTAGLGRFNCPVREREAVVGTAIEVDTIGGDARYAGTAPRRLPAALLGNGITCLP